MAQLKEVVSGLVHNVSKNPRWDSGVWDGGDQRFTDPTGTAYVPVLDYAPLLPEVFYGAFKTSEMIAIKASTDPYVMEFFARFKVFQVVGRSIDPNTVSVQEGLQYLAKPAPDGPGILANAQRITDISNGVLQ